MMNPPRQGFAPPIVLQLLIANGVLFVLTAFVQLPLDRYFALWPMGTPEMAMTSQGPQAVPGWMPWQLLTYGFLHANLGHIFFNMFALWMFGSALENDWGSRRFLFFYLVCVIGAGMIQTLVATISAAGGMIYPTVGASGGVFGILLGFGMAYPNARIMLLIPPMPIKAKYFVIGYGALTLFFGMTGTQAGVAHFAHLGGMLFGFLTIIYWRNANRRR